MAGGRRRSELRQPALYDAYCLGKKETKQGKDIFTAPAAPTASITHQRHPRAASKKSVKGDVVHQVAAAPYYKRRWRLLAYQSMLATSFKTATPQDEKGQYFSRRGKALQRQNCAVSSEKKGDSRNSLLRRKTLLKQVLRKKLYHYASASSSSASTSSSSLAATPSFSRNPSPPHPSLVSPPAQTCVLSAAVASPLSKKDGGSGVAASSSAPAAKEDTIAAASPWRNCSYTLPSLSPPLAPAAASSVAPAAASSVAPAAACSATTPAAAFSAPAAGAASSFTGDSSSAASLCTSVAAPVPSSEAAASLFLHPPSFSALGVSPALFRVAAGLHIERPSPIQVLSLPRAFRGGDLCGVAPTGTGKTLCYCWPLLQRIANGHGHAFLGLVLLPARELAVQVLEQFRIYGAALGVRLCLLLGGRDLAEEGKALLHQAPHILIATPGRLADHVENDTDTLTARLAVVEVLVLDEADMLLSAEFEDDLKSILECLPPSSAAARSLSSHLHKGQQHDGAFVFSPSSSSFSLSSRRRAEEDGGGESGGEARKRLSAVLNDNAANEEEGRGEERKRRQQLPSKQQDEIDGEVGSGDNSRSHAPHLSGRAAWKSEEGGGFPFRLHRQTLLFSATVSPALLALQQRRFGEALMPLFDVTAAAAALMDAHAGAAADGEQQQKEKKGEENFTTVAQQQQPQQPQPQPQQVLLPRLTHYYLFVPKTVRFVYLLHLLEHVPPFNKDRGIIFAGSVRQTQRLCTALEVLQQQATPLHSLMKQRTRIACLEKFRSEIARLLVCTDVAGRGLDLPRVEFVICLDVPPKPQVYVHRTGRTARAGRKGVALTFVEPDSVRAVHRIEAYIHTKLQPLPFLEEGKVLQQINHYSRVLQKAALFLNEIGFDEKAEQHETYTKAVKELRRKRKNAAGCLSL